MPDYEILRFAWWLLVGILLAGFAITDGFDLGVACLLPIIGKNDLERRTVLNTIGPVWEGNQVWLVLGAGALFAAWPLVYAVAFSGFYYAMLATLFALILRPVGFKFRSKVNCQKWRLTWDVCLFIAGFVPSLIFGVAIGNVILGVPFILDEDLRIFYSGSFMELLNPLSLTLGILVVAMFCIQAASFLTIKLEKNLASRARRILPILTTIMLISYLGASLWVAKNAGYSVLSYAGANAPSNPLTKTAVAITGAYTINFSNNILLLLAPIIVIFANLIILIGYKSIKPLYLFLISSLNTLAVVATLGIGTFPFILPSSINPSISLTVFDASSSYLTLFVMAIATIIFMPIILFYTSWVYKVLAGPVKTSDIEKNADSMY